ncbi:MAG: adenylosuccinate synthetase, partial [Thermoprotei archaeon]
VGIGPKRVDEVILVFKSYVTRVGAGPLEGELSEEDAERLGLVEYATVTGRRRRSAPFNLNLARRAIILNSPTQIAITKIDTLYPQAKGVREYSKLPREAREFIERIEEELKTPVTLIGTGPRVEDMVDLRGEKLGID